MHSGYSIIPTWISTTTSWQHSQSLMHDDKLIKPVVLKSTSYIRNYTDGVHFLWLLSSVHRPCRVRTNTLSVTVLTYKVDIYTSLWNWTDLLSVRQLLFLPYVPSVLFAFVTNQTCVLSYPFVGMASGPQSIRVQQATGEVSPCDRWEMSSIVWVVLLFAIFYWMIPIAFIIWCDIEDGIDTVCCLGKVLSTCWSPM